MNLSEHEKYMAEWHKKHGVPASDEAGPSAYELFIEPESDMDDTLRVEVKGDKVILSDHAGWAEEYKLADIKALVAKHGKLATWEDFARLGALKSRDVADDDQE